MAHATTELISLIDAADKKLSIGLPRRISIAARIGCHGGYRSGLEVREVAHGCRRTQLEQESVDQRIAFRSRVAGRGSWLEVLRTGVPAYIRISARIEGDAVGRVGASAAATP